MELSPEQRRRIYEEEKEKLEKEQANNSNNGKVQGTQIPQNVAGLLCYLAGWVTGIIFMIIEPKNKFVRFHAMQSIVVFGSITILSGLFGLLPILGVLFKTLFGLLAFILWIVLMIKAYQGDMFKLPVAGVISESILGAAGNNVNKGAPPVEQGARSEDDQQPDMPASDDVKTKKASDDNYSSRGRTGRIAGYSLAIIWSFAVLVFLSFFYRYIAIYIKEPGGTFTRLPILTSDYLGWLPILITVLILSITIYIFLIIYEKYWFRETMQIVLNGLGFAAVSSLVYIFPFDFSVIPSTTIAEIAPIVTTIVLILIAVGFVIGAVVSLVKLIISLLRVESG